MGSALPLGAGSREGGRGALGTGGSLGASVEISGLRDCRGAGGPRSLLWELHRSVEGERSGECVAGGAGVEFCPREREIDAADHAGEGGGGSDAARGRALGT